MSPLPRPGAQATLLLALPALLAGLVGVALWGSLLVHPTLLHIDEAWVWASSQLGSLPFGDGWRGTDRVDRLLPPLHSWLSRAMGGGLPAIRLASLLEGCLAASLTALPRSVAMISGLRVTARYSVPGCAPPSSAGYHISSVSMRS